MPKKQLCVSSMKRKLKAMKQAGRKKVDIALNKWQFDALSDIYPMEEKGYVVLIKNFNPPKGIEESEIIRKIHEASIRGQAKLYIKEPTEAEIMELKKYRVRYYPYFYRVFLA